jgi:hypothetical protein
MAMVAAAGSWSSASTRTAPSTSTPVGATVPRAMTAKEKLRERVEALTEEQAAETLRLIEQRANDPVLGAFRDAPLDDESWTEEDEAAAAQGRADLAAGRTVSLDEAMRELG